MGECSAESRLAVLHKNSKGTLAAITSIVGDADVNVADMTNKSRDVYAYTLMDLDSALPKDLVAKIDALESVIKVRVVK